MSATTNERGGDDAEGTRGGTTRRHPDIFTAGEAAAYLGFDSVRSLETIRVEYGLVGHRPAGKAFMYHRTELDRVALKMFGLANQGDSIVGVRR